MTSSPARSTSTRMGTTPRTADASSTPMRAETDNKILIIFKFTETLNVLDILCRDRRYGCLILDVTMPTTKRQKMVDRFPKAGARSSCSRPKREAEECGIKLIGADRLFLFDHDWNPASDIQTLARV